jgi:radical SAM superfamily enzyme YgiQ (UPF0313 family)
MKILFVSPTALDDRGRPIKQRRIHLPGLTFPMLAAVTPRDVELKLILETVQDIPYDEHWDLVGLTGMGSGVARAWQIADAFRMRGTTVVLGGIGSSLGQPEWSLEHVDSLVIGEAEEIWPQVLDDFAGGRLNKIYRMERRPPIESLPVPRYDVMPRSRLGLWRPVQATRGCPFSCSFCSVTAFFGSSYRKRPVDQVIRDVRAAKRSGSRYIAFIDDNIGASFNYCMQLWEALIPEKIIWIGQCSLHIADRPDMLKLARRSGCRLLSFGIESTSPQSLKTVDKERNQPQRYRDAIERIRKHGIDVSTEMIIGLDGDDASVFQKTYDFIIENRISTPRIHILTPCPGTRLYDQFEKEGRIVSQDFGHYSGGRVVYQPLKIDPLELQKGYWDLYEKLFTWSTILRRAGRNRARLDPYMRAFVLGVNVHYRNHIHRRICPGIV